MQLICELTKLNLSTIMIPTQNQKFPFRWEKHDIHWRVSASLPFNRILATAIHWITFAVYNSGFGLTFDIWNHQLQHSPHLPHVRSIIAKVICSSNHFASYNSASESFLAITIKYQFVYELSLTINESYIDSFSLKTIRKSNRTPNIRIMYWPEWFIKQFVKSISESHNRFYDS